jgi:hypothetical protein
MSRWDQNWQRRSRVFVGWGNPSLMVGRIDLTPVEVRFDGKVRREHDDGGIRKLLLF